MALDEDLERIAGLAAARGDGAGGRPAAPARGTRLYLVALAAGEERHWLVLDEQGAVVERRDDVRDAASIIAMCELSAELAGGGDLEQLRAQLVQVRMVEQAPGIEEAEAAALALEQAVGSAPRLATPAYLDQVGAATLALERALGDLSSPFSEALRAGTGSVDEFVRDVERDYALSLS